MRRTVTEFKADVAKLVREQYAMAVVGWKQAPRHVKGAGYRGLVEAVAGHMTRFFLVEGDETHTMVR